MKSMWHTINEEPVVNGSDVKIVVVNGNHVENARYGIFQKTSLGWEMFCKVNDIDFWAYWDVFVETVKDEAMNASKQR